MSRRSLLAITFALAVVLAVSVSCSRDESPTAPGHMTSGQASLGACFGVFQILPGDDLSEAHILPVRTSQFDVTRWAEIEVIETVWDPVLRNWTLTVRIANPTTYSGWGVQAIFTDLGGKEMRWPDGYLWLDLEEPPVPERYPFFAIEKTTPDREFAGMHVCVQELTFHFPEGVEKWIPISFFIDANLGGPRPEPMVEDLDMAHFPPPCEHATVTARVQDHQSPSAELEVWVDLSPIGGGDREPMFDDGNHDDGGPDDGIFGAEFTGGNMGDAYILTLYAGDPEGNGAENDIVYSPIGYPPLPPINFETLFIGPFCMFEDERLEVLEDTPSWEAFWAEFSPWDMSAPEIDFDLYRVVAVCIGERPDDCYSVEIDSVDWSSVNCGWAVHYTETVPGPKCECNDVVTSPFHLITVNRAAFDVMFEGSIYEDPCTDPQDPCLDLFDVASGNYGVAERENMAVIDNESDWVDWWHSNVGGGSPPNVDFDTYMCFAVTMGERRTSGYYATIDSACLDDSDELEIVVGWHIPGEGCMVLQVITHPYTVLKAEKFSYPYYWTTYDDVYKCD